MEIALGTRGAISLFYSYTNFVVSSTQTRLRKRTNAQ
jgi:hypothetical protein